MKTPHGRNQSDTTLVTLTNYQSMTGQLIALDNSARSLLLNNNQLQSLSYLSWCMKNWLLSINNRDTVTKVVVLYSLYQALSYKPDLTLLASFLPDCAFLRMLIVLDMVCTGRTSQEYITSSNKPTLCERVLAMWDYTLKMAPGIMNTMVPLLWKYLRYWWKEVNVLSTRITFDWVYHRHEWGGILPRLSRMFHYNNSVSYEINMDPVYARQEVLYLMVYLHRARHWSGTKL